MIILIPNKNVVNDSSFGQIINIAKREYIDAELQQRHLKNFSVALIEVFNTNKKTIYLNNELELSLEFKKPSVKPTDVGKPFTVNLKDIKDVSWDKKIVAKNSAKILIVRFNKDWWILNTDFKNNKTLENKFKITRTFKVRSGGYLPLQLKRQEKNKTLQQWRDEFESGLNDMWRRHLTVTQRYYGTIVYDGNYYDLFLNAHNLFILGYYYEAIILCRTAAEQALVQILVKEGKGFEIYKKPKRLKSIEQLVKTCRSKSLFPKKYPLNKIGAKKLNNISIIAGGLVHPKSELNKGDSYKDRAVECMDNLHYVIKRHLNFIKDTGVVSGYKFLGTTKRLK